jgi:inward rectifier potassium channel
MGRIRKKAQEFSDLGLGSRISGGQRMVNPDGSFNVIRKGVPFLQARGIYHWLISMSWTKFIFIVIAGYLAINLLFAGMYVFVGVENLDGTAKDIGINKFLEAFFFSTQTFTTVGYGRINPVGIGANLLAALESMSGLMSFALATGILYGRFSKPGAKVMYSQCAIIAPYRGITAFEFRIANQRSNQLIEAEVSLSFSITNDYEGVPKRDFYTLPLERSGINFFPMSWTIVHPIDEDSPLAGLYAIDLVKGEAEFIILFKAFDDTFSQIVYSRSSYRPEEVVYGAKFSNIYGKNEDGVTTLDLTRLSEYEKVPMPELVQV